MPAYFPFPADLHCSSHLGILGAGKLELNAHGVAGNGFVCPPCLPQGIAQVVVGLREVGLPSNGFLVGLDGLVQLALLIEHSCR